MDKETMKSFADMTDPEMDEMFKEKKEMSFREKIVRFLVGGTDLGWE